MIAVRVNVGPSIMLRSGAWFDFLDPRSSGFTIEDIAHGLANICRYSGQCSSFYSVAEHSLLVSESAVGHEREALMHDAAEAFLGDVTRPLKQLLPEFKKIEREVEIAILERFELCYPLSPAIKQADLRVLAAEQAQIMPAGANSWAEASGVEPAPIRVRHLSPDDAYREFLARFEMLMAERPRRKLA